MNRRLRYRVGLGTWIPLSTMIGIAHAQIAETEPSRSPDARSVWHEHWSIAGELAAAFLASTPGVGAGASVAVYRDIGHYIELGGRVHVSATPRAPDTTGQVRSSNGFQTVLGRPAIYSSGPAFRLRPFGTSPENENLGPWLESILGPALVEGVFCGAIHTGLGYTFHVSHVGVSPSVRYTHFPTVGSALDTPVGLASLGLEFSFLPR